MNSKNGSFVFPGIRGDGGTTAYIKQTGSTIEYSFDKNTWELVFFPCNVENTNTNLGILKIEFITDIVFNSTDNYFICTTNNIQFGSELLKEDGTRPIITIDNVSRYPGLIKNGDWSTSGYNNIHVYNLKINSINSTLYVDEGSGSGWVCHQNYAKNATNNWIVNCSSNGPIDYACGGIIGPYSGSITVIGCSSSGEINGGGIIGEYAGSNAEPNTQVTIQSCWTTGIIAGYGSGGIMGSGASKSIITDCYSKGNISGEGAGGIVGRGVGPDLSGTVFINNCYSTGDISGYQTGGIAGAFADYIQVSNCYTTGHVIDQYYNPNVSPVDPAYDGLANGAICGFHNPVNNIIIGNCYASGIVDTAGTARAGYLDGKDRNNYQVSSVNNFYSEAQNNSSGWKRSSVNTVLLGLPNLIEGDTWMEPIENQPFELKNMGYTPYSILNINLISTPILNQSHQETINSGVLTQSALIANRSYFIVEITGGNYDSYPLFTMNSNTGEVMTQSTVIPGVYTLLIRNIGDDNNGEYYYSYFILTINEPNNDSNLMGLMGQMLYQAKDRRSIYNVYNYVVTHNNSMVVNKRLDINSSLSKAFNHKFS